MRSLRRSLDVQGELFAALRERGDCGFEFVHCSFSERQFHVVKSRPQQCDLPRPGAWRALHRLQILGGVRDALHIFAQLPGGRGGFTRLTYARGGEITK
jgi:hypothetical protein